MTLDLRMPGRDGLDLLSTLWAARPEIARRTLVVTGTALSPADCHRLARCGASLLAKPFRIEELLDLLGKQLSETHQIPFSRN
jgi:DNA-binding response OmpR family regulator